MSMKKSAKDIAFDKECMKFRKRIRELEQENKNLRNQIEEEKEKNRELDKKIRELNEWIERLLQYTELSEDDMKKRIETENQEVEIANSLHEFYEIMESFRDILRRVDEGEKMGSN